MLTLILVKRGLLLHGVERCHGSLKRFFIDLFTERIPPPIYVVHLNRDGWGIICDFSGDHGLKLKRILREFRQFCVGSVLVCHLHPLVTLTALQFFVFKHLVKKLFIVFLFNLFSFASHVLSI